MFADSRYADIEKKCRYADIADADINIGTPLFFIDGRPFCVSVFGPQDNCLNRTQVVYKYCFPCLHNWKNKCTLEAIEGHTSFYPMNKYKCLHA